jgi:SH3-like domain-containing protein
VRIFAGVLLLISNIASALCVTASSASLRSGPGTKYPVTWKAGRYTPLVEIGHSGGWTQVQDMDGETYWVTSSSVTRKWVCVSVRVNSAKLHKTKGSQSELADIRQVDRYTPFKRLDDDGEWYQVEAAWGETYWISENAVWRPLKLTKVTF